MDAGNDDQQRALATSSTKSGIQTWRRWSKNAMQVAQHASCGKSLRASTIGILSNFDLGTMQTIHRIVLDAKAKSLCVEVDNVAAF
jgi:hypothetical protein